MMSINKSVGSFPHPTIAPIIGKPTYETILPVHLFLSANAASVQLHLGNGRLGLFFLTVLPAVLKTLSQIQFVPPSILAPMQSIPQAPPRHKSPPSATPTLLHPNSTRKT